MKPSDAIAPDGRLSWETVKAAFDAARALELQFDATYLDAVVVAARIGSGRSAQRIEVPSWVWAVSENLTDARNAAEEAVIFFPAPDLAAVIWKIEYARLRSSDMIDWPEEWWTAVLADLRRLAGQSGTVAATDPDPASLMAELETIDTAMVKANQDRCDENVSASVYAAYALYDRIEALPNTGAYLGVRARAIGSAVDNTSDVAKLNLGELSAHAESNAGQLIRQVLACILDGAPKSGDTPALNIEVAA